MPETRIFSPEEQESVLGRRNGYLIVCSVIATESSTKAQVSAEVKLPSGADPGLIEKLRTAVAAAVENIIAELAGE